MLVGEVPGDQEDRAGQPFVGPAGQLLRDALVEAGIDVKAVYLTNGLADGSSVIDSARA